MHYPEEWPITAYCTPFQKLNLQCLAWQCVSQYFSELWPKTSGSSNLHTISTCQKKHVETKIPGHCICWFILFGPLGFQDTKTAWSRVYLVKICCAIKPEKWSRDILVKACDTSYALWTSVLLSIEHGRQKKLSKKPSFQKNQSTPLPKLCFLSGMKWELCCWPLINSNHFRAFGSRSLRGCLILKGTS